MMLTALQRFGAAIGLFLSFVLASASVAGSFFVSTKPLFGVPLGVLLAAVGCFASGWIFAIYLRKVGFLGSRERDTAETLRQQKNKIDILTKETDKLRAEINRLAKQRIDINAFSPILQLGLAEADMVITDFQHEWIDGFEKGIMGITNATQSQYVGVLQQSFKAVVGFDLKKLRIYEESGYLRVVGIVPESLGLKNHKSKWLLRSLHKFTLKKITPTGPTPELDDLTQVEHDGQRYEIDKERTYDGCMDLNRTNEYSERQKDALDDRINNVEGADFKNINEYIQKMAKGVVEIFLAPVKKPIVFDNSTLLANIDGKDGWFTLEDFVKNYNSRIDAIVQSSAKPTLTFSNMQVASQEDK